MVCAPVFDFMHGSLEVGGSKWDELQFIKRVTGAPREYRGIVAAVCKLEGIAMQGLRYVAFNKSAWGVILPQQRTVSFRNAQFQITSTFTCCIKKNHTDIHLNFPWIGFLWLLADTPLEAQYDNVFCKDR